MERLPDLVRQLRAECHDDPFSDRMVSLQRNNYLQGPGRNRFPSCLSKSGRVAGTARIPKLKSVDLFSRRRRNLSRTKARLRYCIRLCQTDRKNESCPQMGKKTADRRMYSLNTTDKKASRKIKHRKISRVHKLTREEFYELKKEIIAIVICSFYFITRHSSNFRM